MVRGFGYAPKSICRRVRIAAGRYARSNPLYFFRGRDSHRLHSKSDHGPTSRFVKVEMPHGNTLQAQEGCISASHWVRVYQYFRHQEDRVRVTNRMPRVEHVTVLVGKNAPSRHIEFGIVVNFATQGESEVDTHF